MSEQAPERPAEPARPSGQPGGPPARENVFTRKLGPLPMWVWLAIAAVLVVGYFLLVRGKGKSGQQGPGQNPQRGYGRALLPDIVVNRFVNRPPHAHHHHRRHHHDRDPDPDPGGERDATALEAGRQAAIRDPGPGEHNIPGHNRRHMRGEPIPGELVQFKTADRGQTPSLQDVANHYGTDPEAIVMEAEGRGYPTSTAWKRYVSRHDWGSPLPPATDLSILAHPTG